MTANTGLLSMYFLLSQNFPICRNHCKCNTILFQKGLWSEKAGKQVLNVFLPLFVAEHPTYSWLSLLDLPEQLCSRASPRCYRSQPQPLEMGKKPRAWVIVTVWTNQAWTCAHTRGATRNLTSRLGPGIMVNYHLTGILRAPTCYDSCSWSYKDKQKHNISGSVFICFLT